MRKLHLLFAVLLGLLVNSCSDSTSTENGNNNNGGNGGGDRSLTIVSVDQDSVYWGDTVTVTLKNALSDEFELFVHTIPIQIATATHKADSTATVTFVVPQDASTGLIRIFEGETEAKESRTLVILPKDRSSMFPSFDHFAPGRVYTGDLFVITGHDIPMRWRDMEVKIGDVPLEIINWDPTRIYTRIPAAVQTGIVTLRMFDQVFQLGTVVKLEHSGPILPEGTVSFVRLYVARVQGSDRDEMFPATGGDTVVTETFGRLTNFDMSRSFDQIDLERKGDSLIGVRQEFVNGVDQSFEMRLRLEPESRVSGRLRVTWITGDETNFWETEIKSMRWLRDGNISLIYTHSSDLPNELVAFRTGSLRPNMNMFSTYTTGEETSVINIELRP